VHPRPKLSLKDACDLLPAIHKVGGLLATANLWNLSDANDDTARGILHCRARLQYDIRPLLSQLSEQLAQELPRSWSMDESVPHTYLSECMLGGQWLCNVMYCCMPASPACPAFAKGSSVLITSPTQRHSMKGVGSAACKVPAWRRVQVLECGPTE
jgi:hypothetical protein